MVKSERANDTTTQATENAEAVVIRKYANRRLYDTETSAYVTLEDLREMVKRGIDFVVLDAKTGEDLTRQTLAQIIFEQEAHGQNLLPIRFLKSIISFYDGNLRDLVPPYLEASMESFIKNQDQMREYARRAMGDFSPFTQLEEVGRQNMELFRKAFQMFTPFEFSGKEDPKKPDASRKSGNKP